MNSSKDFPLILLAGGRSSRMGTPKGLLDYQGHPWMVEQLKGYKAAFGKQAIIVLGFHQAQYFEQIPWLEKAVQQPVEQLGLEVSVVINPAPEQGQFSSLQGAAASLDLPVPRASFNYQKYTRPGYRASFRRKPESSMSPKSQSPWMPDQVRHDVEPTAPNLISEVIYGQRDNLSGFAERPCPSQAPDAERPFVGFQIPGAFILPIDVPCPGKEVFESLSAAFQDSIDAVIPQYQSKGGHPVLLSSVFLLHLAKVSLSSPEARLDLQIRTLSKDRIRFVQVNDPLVCLNMNYLDEFKAYSHR